jgi:MFS family permease
VVQGLAIGAQWGGAVLLATESAPPNKRGFYGGFAQAGAPVGVVLANVAVLVMSTNLSNEAFMSWGWRIPFIASLVLIGIALCAQLRVEETPAFRQLQAEKRRRRAAGRGTRGFRLVISCAITVASTLMLKETYKTQMHDAPAEFAKLANSTVVRWTTLVLRGCGGPEPICPDETSLRTCAKIT